MYDSRVTLSSEVKADIEQFLENARQSECPWSDAVIIPVHIRRNIKLAEAPSYGKTIFEYEPNCHGSEDYQSVAQFLHSQSSGVCPEQSGAVVVSGNDDEVVAEGCDGVFESSYVVTGDNAV